MPTLSQLSANGNYTIAGTFDEATFNSTSSYRKNIIINSQNFSAAEWRHYDSSSAVAAAPNIAGPDGSYGQVYKLYETSVSGWHAFGQNLNSKYSIGTVSCYVKAAENWICGFDVNSFGSNSQFNLKTGTVQNASGWLNPTITFVGNGWYRISAYIVSGTFPNYQSYDGISVALSQNGTTTYLGVPGNGIYIWGFQFELDISGPSIYEPTGPNGIPVANFATKLDSTGNFYTAGIIDEVTYNKTRPVFKNLLTYTESFNAAVWQPNLGIVVPNAILAPDGKSYAIKLVERIDGSTITSNQRIINNKIEVDANTIYTFSIYLKSGGRDYARIYFEDSRATGGDGGGRVGALLNLASGTITSTYLTGSNTLLSSNLQKFDNGWFRFSWTVKTLLSSPVNGTSYIIFGMGNTPTSFAYIGDGVSGMYFWGIQMEKGSQVTTYQGVDAPGVLIDSNTTTRLESTGNHYLAGAAPTYDEVTGILPVTDSLVTYLDPALLQSYPGSGTTWYDLSGNNHHGTLNGSRTPTVHPLGYLGLNAQQALNGQQSTQRLGQSVTFNNNPALYFERRKPWTIVIWFKLTADPGPNSYARIFDRDLNPDGSGRRGFNLYAVQNSGTNINISSERWAPKQTSASVGFTVPTSSFLNTWNNVTVTYDGTTLTMYRNGVSVSTAASTGEAEIVQGQYTIFLYAANNGYVGQNLIYSRALTATEVLATYNATKLRYVY